MDSALTAVGSSGLPLHLQSISCQKGSVSKICSTTCLWSTYGCAVVCPSTSRKEEQSYNLQSVCRTAWEHVCIGWKPLSIGSIDKYSTNGYNHSSINWLTKNVLQVSVQCGFTQVLDHSEFNSASVIETECLGSMTKIQRCFSHETSGYCRKYTLWEMKVYDIFTTTYLLAKGFPGTHISLAWDTLPLLL